MVLLLSNLAENPCCVQVLLLGNNWKPPSGAESCLHQLMEGYLYFNGLGVLEVRMCGSAERGPQLGFCTARRSVIWRWTLSRLIFRSHIGPAVSYLHMPLAVAFSLALVTARAVLALVRNFRRDASLILQFDIPIPRCRKLRRKG